jgi:hypothetical protein
MKRFTLGRSPMCVSVVGKSSGSLVPFKNMKGLMLDRYPKYKYHVTIIAYMRMHDGKYSSIKIVEKPLVISVQSTGIKTKQNKKQYGNNPLIEAMFKSHQLAHRQECILNQNHVNEKCKKVSSYKSFSVS